MLAPQDLREAGDYISLSLADFNDFVDDLVYGSFSKGTGVISILSRNRESLYPSCSAQYRAGGEEPQLLVFEHPAGAWFAQPERFDLQTPAAQILIDTLDGDAFRDVAVLQGTELFLLHGRDRQLTRPGELRNAESSQGKQSHFGFSEPLLAMASGGFLGDRLTWRLSSARRISTGIEAWFSLLGFNARCSCSAR